MEVSVLLAVCSFSDQVVFLCQSNSVRHELRQHRFRREVASLVVTLCVFRGSGSLELASRLPLSLVQEERRVVPSSASEEGCGVLERLVHLSIHPRESSVEATASCHDNN